MGAAGSPVRASPSPAPWRGRRPASANSAWWMAVIRHLQHDVLNDPRGFNPQPGARSAGSGRAPAVESAVQAIGARSRTDQRQGRRTALASSSAWAWTVCRRPRWRLSSRLPHELQPAQLHHVSQHIAAWDSPQFMHRQAPESALTRIGITAAMELAAVVFHGPGPFGFSPSDLEELIGSGRRSRSKRLTMLPSNPAQGADAQAGHLLAVFPAAELDSRHPPSGRLHPHWLARAFMRVMASCSAVAAGRIFELFVVYPPKPGLLARFRASSLGQFITTPLCAGHNRRCCGARCSLLHRHGVA